MKMQIWIITYSYIMRYDNDLNIKPVPGTR